MIPTHHLRPSIVVTLFIAAMDCAAQSLNFLPNANSQHDYARHVTIPSGFGSGEFTLEVWLRPNNSFPVGPVGVGTQLTNWYNGDPQPYSSGNWWFSGNFLLDGHNNSSFKDGTFSLQFVGGGRVRWDFGDGAQRTGGHWAVQAWPSNTTPSLLDGGWHHIACVRRWVGEQEAALELWVDGGLVATETSDRRTNMRTAYWNNWTGYPASQQGWFWGSEKQAAVLANGVTQYEDYKGLVDELRFWNRAKTSEELRLDWETPITGTEQNLTGWYTFSEGSGTETCNDITGNACMTLSRTTANTWSPENAPGTGSTPPDADYVFANFDAVTQGNGTEATPFNTVAASVNFANANATIEVLPSTSTEAPTISKALTVINGNPAGGIVTIGSSARAVVGQAQVGFVAVPR